MKYLLYNNKKVKVKTVKCGRCGYSHRGYSIKLDKNRVAYVVCEQTNKRMNVCLGKELDEKLRLNCECRWVDAFYITAWVIDVEDPIVNIGNIA
ncbi:MAG: hypothetical protein ABIH71_01970 [Candidatus Omnitrophota bacterium]